MSDADRERMAGSVYLLMFTEYDRWQMVGIFSTRELAEAALMAWAEAENAQHERDADFFDDHWKPEALMPARDRGGFLCCQRSAGGGIYVSEWTLDGTAKAAARAGQPSD